MRAVILPEAEGGGLATLMLMCSNYGSILLSIDLGSIDLGCLED